MRARFILEEFQEKSDPIVDMGIGQCERKAIYLEKQLGKLYDEYYERSIEEETGEYDEAMEAIEDIIDYVRTIFEIR